METANDNLNRFIGMSVLLHAMLFAVVVFAPKLFPEQTPVNWGTSSEKGIKVGYTNSLPGIPLPSPPRVEETAKGNDSDTLNPAEVAPKPQEKLPAVADVKIPTGITKPEPRSSAASNATRGKPAPEPPAPSNAIPGQASGQIALPYGAPAATGTGAATFGDGSFGTRFPEYVSSMIRAIQAEWQKPPGIPFGTKVYVTFTIPKQGGRVHDVEIDQPSGSAPMDNSAKRAIMTALMPSLPREYSGSSIGVRFYFENTR